LSRSPHDPSYPCPPVPCVFVQILGTVLHVPNLPVLDDDSLEGGEYRFRFLPTSFQVFPISPPAQVDAVQAFPFSFGGPALSGIEISSLQVPLLLAEKETGGRGLTFSAQFIVPFRWSSQPRRGALRLVSTFFRVALPSSGREVWPCFFPVAAPSFKFGSLVLPDPFPRSVLCRIMQLSFPMCRNFSVGARGGSPPLSNLLIRRRFSSGLQFYMAVCIESTAVFSTQP